jgi:hypothetical protein
MDEPLGLESSFLEEMPDLEAPTRFHQFLPSVAKLQRHLHRHGAQIHQYRQMLTDI